MYKVREINYRAFLQVSRGGMTPSWVPVTAGQRVCPGGLSMQHDGAPVSMRCGDMPGISDYAT